MTIEEEIEAACNEAAQEALKRIVGRERVHLYRVTIELHTSIHHINGSVEFESQADRADSRAKFIIDHTTRGGASSCDMMMDDEQPSSRRWRR